MHTGTWNKPLQNDNYFVIQLLWGYKRRQLIYKVENWLSWSVVERDGDLVFEAHKVLPGEIKKIRWMVFIITEECV